MRFRAATALLVSAITVFGIVSLAAAPALAQSAGQPHAVANPLPVLPLRPRLTADLATRPTVWPDDDGPDAPAPYGLSARQRRQLLLLGLAQHGAAFFDARATREAIGNNYRELDPLLRPFAHSAALYPVMQIAPTGLDWLALRLIRSRHRWLRRLWWLPQAAATAGFIWSGAHDLGLPRAH